MHNVKTTPLNFKELLFYFFKPFVPRFLQILIRRQIIRRKRIQYSSIWPVNEQACNMPVNWNGWPERKQFALILQHDVDTQRGHDNCRRLMDIEEEFGMRSTFYLVPERYRVSPPLIDEIKQRGFGIGVHGLKHDGKLFLSYNTFKTNAEKINGYLRMWNTRGFSSPSMISRLDWMHHLEIDFSTSTFDTDPFEPQPEPVNTIFPFVVKNTDESNGFVELPYTLPQDFTLFVLMQEKDISIWKRKTEWIAKYGGMVLVNTHPDYMNFDDDKKCGTEEYPVRYYSEFVTHLKTIYAGRFWNALSQEIAAYIRSQVNEKSR
jgi:peptidoglycan/xylan/chitin deacetylase (PgdA/CDA1 family)